MTHRRYVMDDFDTNARLKLADSSAENCIHKANLSFKFTGYFDVFYKRIIK